MILVFMSGSTIIIPLSSFLQDARLSVHKVHNLPQIVLQRLLPLPHLVQIVGHGHNQPLKITAQHHAVLDLNSRLQAAL